MWTRRCGRSTGFSTSSAGTYPVFALRPDVKVRIERLLLGGLMSAVAFLLDRRLRRLTR
jgi:hypothetical protein